MPTDAPRSDLADLRDLQRQFLGAIALADPATSVPWCGRWKVKDLVIHLARVHHWAAAKAQRRSETPLGRGPFVLTDLYASCAQELADVLLSLDPLARAHTLLDDGVPRAEQTGTVAFWDRRQKLETLVHLWDLRTAAGLDWPDSAVGRATTPQEALWWDCVDEVAGVMHPRQVRLGRVAPPPVRLVLRRPDGHAITFNGGLTREVVDELPPITVHASARDLALLVWGRADPGSANVDVTGDDGERGALRGLLAAGLTP